MTRSISAVAVCRSSASCVSLNSRTFSIAITAWSAKVCSSAICLARERPARQPRRCDRADRLALAQQRHRRARSGSAEVERRARLRGYSVSSRSATSAMWTRARARGWRARPSSRGCSGIASSELAAVGAGRRPAARTEVHRPPSSSSVTALKPAVQSSAARCGDRVEHRLHVGRRAADDLQDLGGRRLLLERLLVSLNSRTFSIAITAWSAKVCSSLICLLGEVPGLAPAHADRADHQSSRSNGTATMLR